MGEDAFIPKYGIVNIAIITIGSSGLVLFPLFFDVRDVSTAVYVVLLLFCDAFLLINWITSRFFKIEFQEDRIFFHRRFLRPLEYSYDSLTLLGSTQLQFGKQRGAVVVDGE
ncbi:MAG: hypothetical protein U0X92_13975 [Anaerolineales bacterium]